MNNLAGLIPLLPWLAALWIGVGSLLGRNVGEAGENPTARVAIGAVFLSLVLMICLDGMALWHGTQGQIQFFPWMESGNYRVIVSMTLDPLSLSMGTLVALVLWLTMVFSRQYLHREEGFQRFFAILSLFSGAMLLIVLAGNPVLTFVGWEIAGLSSFLLIGYAYDRTTAATHATRVFVTNRFGDAGFVMAIALSVGWFGDLEWPDLFGHAGVAHPMQVSLVVGGFLLAALAKSSQMPFAAWLGQALEGPTPSSAVFYGSLMVHAGVFLVLRLAPLLALSHILMTCLVILGLLTAAYGVLCGLVQNDVKSTLIFSTQTQIGLMFAECGAGYFELANLHMLAHAGWRAYQFLSAPAYMHLLDGTTTPPVPAWLARLVGLHEAALQRFWLDGLSDYLLVRPTLAIARDLQNFDLHVINPLVGHYGSSQSLTLDKWEDNLLQGSEGTTQHFAQGRGIMGHVLQKLSSWCQWFEARLIMSSSGGQLADRLRMLGEYLQRVDQFLAQPRYLLLLVVLTFVVIL